MEIFRQQWKEIDLVIFGLIMPKLDGGQAYLEMKKIDNNVKVLFCTGFTSGHAIASCLLKKMCGLFRSRSAVNNSWQW